MEIIFTLLGVILTWFLIMYIADKDVHEGKDVFTAFTIFWWVITYGIYVAGNHFGETEVTKRLDVLEYDKIVYSVPKTIIETKYTAPWWSIRDDNTYTVINETD